MCLQNRLKVSDNFQIEIFYIKDISTHNIHNMIKN